MKRDINQLKGEIEKLLRKDKNIPEIVKDRIKKANALRPITVLWHIIKYGSISTEELFTLYGYDHAPRAARDVRELGVPLITVTGRTKDGRRMGVYKIDTASIGTSSGTGRLPFPKDLKNKLLERDGLGCYICNVKLNTRYLQIDHRVPFEIDGDDGQFDVSKHMLLCASCNRSKSWECEHCANWINKQCDVCKSCFWSGNNEYTHCATVQLRKAEITWHGSEIEQYDRISKVSASRGISLEEALKEAIASYGKDV